MARACEAGVRGVTRCLGELVKAACAALLVLVAPLAAQLPDAEAAFQRGDYGAARAAYERVLATDSTSVRALYQLAILDSWDGKLQRSLDRFIRQRLRSLLRRRRGRYGIASGGDYTRWPNAFFAEHGLFSLSLAHAELRQSRNG